MQLDENEAADKGSTTSGERHVALAVFDGLDLEGVEGEQLGKIKRAVLVLVQSVARKLDGTDPEGAGAEIATQALGAIEDKGVRAQVQRVVGKELEELARRAIASAFERL